VPLCPRQDQPPLSCHLSRTTVDRGPCRLWCRASHVCRLGTQPCRQSLTLAFPGTSQTPHLGTKMPIPPMSFPLIRQLPPLPCCFPHYRQGQALAWLCPHLPWSPLTHQQNRWPQHQLQKNIKILPKAIPVVLADPQPGVPVADPGVITKTVSQTPPPVEDPVLSSPPVVPVNPKTQSAFKDPTLDSTPNAVICTIPLWCLPSHLACIALVTSFFLPASQSPSNMVVHGSSLVIALLEPQSLLRRLPAIPSERLHLPCSHHVRCQHSRWSSRH
jgi:hypothetical protein